jgi:hypothetical protein
MGERDYLRFPSFIPGLASIDVDGALDDSRFHVPPSTDRHEASISRPRLGF